VKEGLVENVLPSSVRLLRPTWFEIDLDAAIENLRTVRRLVGPERKIFAVVKADAYGFGSLEMGRVFAEHGADALAVADLADGVRLRRAGLTLPILVYPSALPSSARDTIAADLIPTLTDIDAARAFDEAAGVSDHEPPTDVFVKVDVGLERLGVPVDHAVKLALAIRELPRLRLAGLCTHLHVPRGADPAYVGWQFARFTGVLDALAAQRVEVPIRLAASSPLVLGFPDTYLNAVDPGRMLYGMSHEDVKGPVPLAPAFRALKSRLIEVKDVLPRERFADAAPFPIAGTMRLGVIPIGIGDGAHRLHAGRVLVRGKSVPILAQPSLEHTRIDLTSVPDAVVGDEVVLIGRQGGEEISTDEIAARYAIDPLGLALGVGPRVARVYVRDGRATLGGNAARDER
jgi:alanine racemase